MGFRTLLSLTAGLLLALGCSQPEDPAVSAVRRILEAHPESTLQDVYKSFYQDTFGPGHIIASREGAEANFDSELEQCTETVKGKGYEPTGMLGRYVRVDMELVKAGIIPHDTLVDAFIEGAIPVTQEALEEWTNTWHELISILDKAKGLKLDGYESDKQMIESVLGAEGNHAIHHSERFSKAYDPHYRIVRKDIFDKMIAPLL